MDAMKGNTSINDGDYILFQYNTNANDNDIVIAVREDNLTADDLLHESDFENMRTCSILNPQKPALTMNRWILQSTTCKSSVSFTP
ncbi:MAG: hypothetical protein IPN96_04505 [Anaerolineales bacterium]|nr:hypothetical protein [Anaerolineales bacterium]